MHSRSQDKLDKDDLDKDKKEKKKEKRNSKHQEIFDKEFKSTDISLQQSEAVILSETIPKRMSRAHGRRALATEGENCISGQLGQLDLEKSMTPDGRHPRMLKSWLMSVSLLRGLGY
ncbi:hypothetical protein llap_22132 [Limosa lapponica baueri]|uniref:Uncharacterized protein n=1 Tax=Limosa lapponica baueri TaxID=1758121 RepID=A0A2I0T1A5_LIMLA|nr:hypothetical protein llap_22132 [Limosa lapponica baueri]